LILVYPRVALVDSANRTYLSNLQPPVFLKSVTLTPANLESLADLFPNAPILMETARGASDETFNPLALMPIGHDAALQLLADRSGLTLESVCGGKRSARSW